MPCYKRLKVKGRKISGISNYIAFIIFATQNPAGFTRGVCVVCVCS